MSANGWMRGGRVFAPLSGLIKPYLFNGLLSLLARFVRLSDAAFHPRARSRLIMPQERDGWATHGNGLFARCIAPSTVAVTVVSREANLEELERVTWGEPRSYRPLKECALITEAGTCRYSQTLDVNVEMTELEAHKLERPIKIWCPVAFIWHIPLTS